jgi:hypothetical protein
VIEAYLHEATIGHQHDLVDDADQSGLIDRFASTPFWQEQNDSHPKKDGRQADKRPDGSSGDDSHGRSLALPLPSWDNSRERSVATAACARRLIAVALDALNRNAAQHECPQIATLPCFGKGYLAGVAAPDRAASTRLDRLQRLRAGRPLVLGLRL